LTDIERLEHLPNSQGGHRHTSCRSSALTGTTSRQWDHPRR
jgi:hypothetical protein